VHCVSCWLLLQELDRYSSALSSRHLYACPICPNGRPRQCSRFRCVHSFGLSTLLRWLFMPSGRHDSHVNLPHWYVLSCLVELLLRLSNRSLLPYSRPDTNCVCYSALHCRLILLWKGCKSRFLLNISILWHWRGCLVGLGLPCRDLRRPAGSQFCWLMRSNRHWVLHRYCSILLALSSSK
jgi:hypothetical protein